jgi:hypothetical protein
VTTTVVSLDKTQYRIIKAENVQRVKQAAIAKINNLTDDEVGEEIRRFFAPKEPSPDLSAQQIDEIVDGWLGED